MGCIVQFPFGGECGSLMKYLKKMYCCGSCGSSNITFEKSKGLKVYTCNACYRAACNPRIFYKLKEEYCDEEKVRDIMKKYNIQPNQGNTYIGKLAVFVAVLNNFLQGGEGISRNIRKFYS